MKIIYKNTPNDKQLTFGDVNYNQFFVCKKGNLYQKQFSESANMIANLHGTPDSMDGVFSMNAPIQRLIPEIEKIEF